MKQNQQILGLNTLRAVGLVMVLIYHLFSRNRLLTAGFFGVDIFFVISGYLITALLINEYKKSGTVNFGDFLARRVLRLLPPLILSVIFILTVSLLASSDFRVGVGKQLAGVFGWVTNYVEMASGQSYEQQLVPHIFKHTWTLAVEMHYYLLWGLIIVALMKLYKHFGVLNATILRRGLAAFSVALALLSYLIMYSMTNGAENFTAAYYSTQSRFYPLMLGSLTGIIFGYDIPEVLTKFGKAIRIRISAWILIPIALFYIVYLSAVLDFNSISTYQYGFVVVSLLTCLIIALMRLYQCAGKSFEPRIFDWLGSRSYGIYLFHWGLYCMRDIIPVPGFVNKDNPTIYYGIVIIILSVILSEISFRITEFTVKLSKKQPIVSTPVVVSAEAESAPLSKQSSIFSGPVFKISAASIGFSFLAALCVLSVYAVANAPKIDEITLDLTSAGRMNLHSQIQRIDDKLIEEELKENLPPVQNDNNNETAEPGETAPLPVENLPAETDDKNNINPTDSYSPEELPASPVYAEGYTFEDGILTVNGGVTIIGDSICLGAAWQLEDVIADCIPDAKESRTMKQGVEIAEEMIADGTLGNTVVFALNNNAWKGSQSQTYTERFLEEVKDLDYKVVYLVGYSPTDQDVNDFADWLLTLPEQYDFVECADWGSAVRSNPDYVYSDGIHLKTDEAKELFAQLIVSAIMRNYNKTEGQVI